MTGRAALAALCALFGGACSALVAPEDIPLRCTEDDACPRGMTCEDEVCVPDDTPDPDGGDCEPNDEPELCNGIDDDCDRQIDEGHDLDEDGVTWCNGGQPTGRDCDDQDPLRTPGKKEVCDGRDNDCNGPVDDDVCEGDLVCEPATGECVEHDCRTDGCEPGYACRNQGGEAWGCVETENPDDCRDGSLVCEDGQICNPQDGECIAGGELDAPCWNDVECSDHLCVEPATLRMADGDGFCARPCCAPEDCPDEFVCWQPAGGYSACVSRERLGLGPGDAAVGAGCATDSDCASGTCVGSSCAAPCCGDADCDDDKCTVSLAGLGDDPLKLVCGDGGFMGPGNVCFESDQCSSNFCVSGLIVDYCTGPCCTSADCGDGLICIYATLDVETDLPQMARLCVEDLDFWTGDPLYGHGVAGADCNDGGDCRSDRCEGGFCVDSCCSSADCPAGTSCRLSSVRDGGELLCLRDP